MAKVSIDIAVAKQVGRIIAEHCSGPDSEGKRKCSLTIAQVADKACVGVEVARKALNAIRAKSAIMKSVQMAGRGRVADSSLAELGDFDFFTEGGEQNEGEQNEGEAGPEGEQNAG